MAQLSSKISKFPLVESEPRLIEPIHIPDNMLSVDKDPTRELRNLIEELQNAARDARGRQRLAEEERDTAIEQLTHTQLEITAARELRSKITALQQDRDTLAEQQKKYATIVSELKQKLEASERQKLDALRQRDEKTRLHSDASRLLKDNISARDEAIKQCDSIARQRDLAKKDHNETVAKLTESQRLLTEAQKALFEAKKDAGSSKKTDAEIQKQLTTLRLARDASSAQVTEIKNRVVELEDQVANLGYDLEKADNTAKQASAETEKLRLQLDEITSEKDAGTRKVAELTNEITVLRKQFDEATVKLRDLLKKLDGLSAENRELKKKNAALKKKNVVLVETEDRLNVELKALRAANTENEAEVCQIRKEIEKVAKERETEFGEFTNKLNELQKAHESQLLNIKQQHETALKERDAARQRVMERESEHEEMRVSLASAKTSAEQLEVDLSEREKHIKSLGQVLSAMEASDKDRQVRLAEVERSAEISERELKESTKELENARNSLVAAEKQIECIINERNTIKQQVTDRALAYEEQLKERRVEIGRLKNELEQALSNSGEYEKLAKRYEEHRLEMIEVSAQLENAQRTIKELSANLAEARIMAKRTTHQFISTAQPTVEAQEYPEEDSLPPEVLEALSGAFVRPITDKSERSAIGAMRHCFQNFSRRSEDLSLLNELSTLVVSFAERARQSGQSVLHRVSSAFASLLQGIYEIPEQISPSVLRTLNQTIEFLACLLKERDLERNVKLATARIYAVDDDRSACEMITEGLKNVGLQSKTTLHPSAAVAELAGSRYDLIILDVQLPDLDGFELCTHIRNMALHAETPIVFLTGNASQENRIESSLRGGNEFFSKPFNLQELGLRALTLIIKSQLRIS